MQCLQARWPIVASDHGSHLHTKSLLVPIRHKYAPKAIIYNACCLYRDSHVAI